MSGGPSGSATRARRREARMIDAEAGAVNAGDKPCAPSAFRDGLRGVGRAAEARATGRPVEAVDAELSHLHRLVPGVVDEVVGLAVRPPDDAVVAGAAHMACDAFEDARLRALPRVRAGDFVGDG